MFVFLTLLFNRKVIYNSGLAETDFVVVHGTLPDEPKGGFWA